MKDLYSGSDTKAQKKLKTVTKIFHEWLWSYANYRISARKYSVWCCKVTA